jgi:ABC-type glycerol-3-phosphate transport system permease component
MRTKNYSSIKIKRLIFTILKYITLIIGVLIVIIPILVLIFAAFKTSNRYATSSKLSLPNSFLYLYNFKQALLHGNILTASKNTAIILIFSLAGNILFGAMVAFVLNRFQFFGKKIILGLYLGAMLIPMVTNQVTTFKLINSLGLFDTLAAPIVLYLGADVVGIYIMLLFMDSIPVSIDESAMLDGASYPYIFFRMILPNLKPAIVTVAIIKGVAIYNDFYIPFLYLPTQAHQTLATALFNFIGPFSGKWPIICADVILMILPTLIIFLLLQKYIYNGFTSGSVKG